MNYKLLLKINGKIMLLEAIFMILPLIVALIYKETSGLAFLPVIAILVVLGLLLGAIKPKRSEIYARESLAIVSTSWIILSFMGCLPFYISGQIPSLIDCFFETVSGFTTTGSSILADVEALSNCMLFWRSFTHWVGGMGILVFMLAISQLLGGYTMNLMRAESPGPSVEKTMPKVRSNAKILYIIYTALTLVQIMLLCLGKMPLFDSILAAFGTAGTGGFGIKNNSIAYYDSYYIQNVITIFMIIFGVNFGVYSMLILGKIRRAFKSEELYLYLAVIAISIALITFNIRPLYTNLYDAFHNSAFHVASIISTTGYSISDFDLWPQFSKAILLLLMFFGASSGSTCGGMKLSRILIMIKFLIKETKSVIHPRCVNTLKVDGHKIGDETVKKIFLFMICYAGLLCVSVIILSLDGHSFTTNVTAVITAISNVGPGFDAVGPVRNFGFFSPLSKFVLSIDMLFGRLEMIPMLILFVPDAWRKR